MPEQHHRCNAHELGKSPGDHEGQEGLACCSPRGRKESHMTGQLNNNNTITTLISPWAICTWTQITSQGFFHLMSLYFELTPPITSTSSQLHN